MKRHGTFFQLFYHYVWATRNRLPIVTPEVEAKLYPYVSTKCIELGYKLHAIGGIEDHVHMLIDPKASLSRINQAVKTFSAREANRILNRKGFAFWANESYDHWVRDEAELARIIEYIENNPVAAGLCTSPNDWRWSSARLRGCWVVGQPFQADLVKA